MPPDVDRTALGERLARHRAELRAFCERRLGATDAEDAVQETFIRAWRSFDRFEGRAPLVTWLYRIATNVCLDMLERRRRRPLPIDLSRFEGGVESAPLVGGSARPEGDPEEAALVRDSVRLALVAAIEQLPPVQRAVLVLREVLRWRASEVAALLETSVPAVNSSLARARATLRASDTSAVSAPTLGARRAALLTRYVDAFERHDLDALTSVLREDATGARAQRVAGSRGPEARSAA